MPVPQSRPTVGRTEQIIPIITNNGNTEYVKATIFSGLVCVHQSLKPRTDFSVDAFKVGYSLVYLPTQEEAEKAALILLQECGQALQFSAVASFLMKCPSWVGVWCQQMKKQGKFLDPEFFKGAFRKAPSPE